MSTTPASLSVVIPVYNEEKVLPELIRRLDGVFDSFSTPYEIILVDDGSRDATLQLSENQAKRNEHYRVLSLSRNFGHQIALTAGLDAANGDVVVAIDGDLQDPPELIPTLMQKILEGYDVVYAVRRKRKDPMLKRLLAWSFYRVFNYISVVEVPLDCGDFGAMSRRAIEGLKQMPERHRYIRGLRSWVGFKQTQMLFDRDERFGGEAKYTLKKQFAFALDGWFTMSEHPLQVATLAGVVVAVLSFLAGLRVVYWKLFADDPTPGYASIAIAIFFLGGLQLVAIGILGEYIGRIHNEVKARPLYLLKTNMGRGLADRAQNT